MVFVGRDLCVPPPCRTKCGAARFAIDRVSGHHTFSLFTFTSYFGKRPPSTTRYGVGTAAFGFAGDCAICGWRFGRLGISLAAASEYFAPCAARPKALPLETAIF